MVGQSADQVNIGLAFSVIASQGDTQRYALIRPRGLRGHDIERLTVPDRCPACSDRVFKNRPGACDASSPVISRVVRSRRCPGSAPSERKPNEERTDAERQAESEVSPPGVSVDLVRFIAEHGSAAKILAEHTPTKDGRCPTCPAGASSSGRVKSPCTLFLAARAAEKIRPRSH
jgi:hypothetical protein